MTDYEAKQEAEKIEMEEMAKIASDYPSLTEADFIEASTNAEQNPCKGMTFLDIFGAGCESIAEEKANA